MVVLCDPSSMLVASIRPRSMYDGAVRTAELHL
jgi:hypothetical protein